MSHPGAPRGRSLRSLQAVLLAFAGAVLVSCSDDVTGPSDLAGGPWTLESMELAGATRFVPDEPDRFMVAFHEDGTISVVADCNQCGGAYSMSGGTLTVPALACTLILCPTPEGGQFASLIDGSSSFQKDGDNRLQIESSDGRLLLSR